MSEIQKEFENTENQEQNNDKLFDILNKREKEIHEPEQKEPEKQQKEQPENPINGAMAEMLTGKLNMVNKIGMRLLNKGKEPVDISDDGQDAIQKWLEFELKRMPAETTLIWIMRISALLGIGESWYIYLTAEKPKNQSIKTEKLLKPEKQQGSKQMELVKKLKSKRDEKSKK